MKTQISTPVPILVFQKNDECDGELKEKEEKTPGPEFTNFNSTVVDVQTIDEKYPVNILDSVTSGGETSSGEEIACRMKMEEDFATGDVLPPEISTNDL